MDQGAGLLTFLSVLHRLCYAIISALSRPQFGCRVEQACISVSPVEPRTIPRDSFGETGRSPWHTASLSRDWLRLAKLQFQPFRLSGDRASPDWGFVSRFPRDRRGRCAAVRSFGCWQERACSPQDSHDEPSRLIPPSWRLASFRKTLHSLGKSAHPRRPSDCSVFLGVRNRHDGHLVIPDARRPS
jgi:hypothetical protein